MNGAGGDRGRLPSGPFLKVKLTPGLGTQLGAQAGPEPGCSPTLPAARCPGGRRGWHGRPHPPLYNELSARAESPIVPPRDVQVAGRLAVPGQGHVGALCVPEARGGEESRASWKENQPPPLLPPPRPAPAPAAPFPCDPPRSFPGGGGAGRPGAPCARRGRGALTWRRLGTRRWRTAGGRAAGSALEAGLGAPGPRGVLFRSGRACPGHANQWALHTAPHRRRCHRTGADVTAQYRSAAPRPEASRLRPGDPRCAPPRRKQRLIRARNFSGLPSSLITRVETRDPRDKTPDKLVPQEKVWGGREVVSRLVSWWQGVTWGAGVRQAKL